MFESGNRSTRAQVEAENTVTRMSGNISSVLVRKWNALVS